MAKYIIKLPEGVTLESVCAVIAHHQLTHRILASAREAVNVDAASMQYYGETENGKIHDKDGKPVTLYAVEAP